MAVRRKKTTVYLDPELLRAAKVLAATTGRHDYEILEDALRQYFAGQAVDSGRDALRALLQQVGGRSDASEDQAMALAYDELHAMRRERRQRGSHE